MNRKQMLVALLVKDDCNDPRLIAAGAFAKALVERKADEAWRTERRDPHTGKWTDSGGPGGGKTLSAKDVVSSGGKHGVQRAIDAVASVHRYPNGMPRINTQLRSRRERGEAALTFKAGKPTGIEINPGMSEDTQVRDVLHELGHFLDLAAFRAEGVPGFASTESGVAAIRRGRGNANPPSPVFQSVLAAIHKTSYYKLGMKLRGRGYPATTRKYAQYFTDPRELVARAYGQWVAERAGLDVIPHGGDNPFVEGFSAEEMKSIAAAFEDILGRRKWMT